MCPIAQGSGTGSAYAHGLALEDDESLILAGYTSGYWSDANQGDFDFAAVKLDADFDEEWRWQVREERGLGDRALHQVRCGLPDAWDVAHRSEFRTGAMSVTSDLRYFVSRAFVRIILTRPCAR